jgi:broad specificity phosphatase PhoE
MNQSTNIVLIRHGESESNIAQRINDDPGRVVNLTAHGRRQAQAAAERLQNRAFWHAYASEFARAQQTAEILLHQHNCELTIDARLNERRSGMDGLPVNVFNNLVSPDPVRIKPPNGESFLEQMGRLRSFLDEISRLHPGKSILAVSHENPILAALALAGMDADQAVHGSIANCVWIDLEWAVD